MLASSVSLLQRKITIYENERYSPISGWSSRGLMPTDRGAFSNADGSESFATLDEASGAMISHGWQYEGEEWMMEKNEDHTDKDGWSYSPDFKSYETNPGFAVKAMMHFVRRRCYYRFQTFDVNSIYDNASLTCDHCDLEEIRRLEFVLLDNLVQLSLTRHPRYISTAKTNALKNAMITCIHLHGESLENVDIGNNEDGDVLSPNYQYSSDRISYEFMKLFQESRSAWTIASSSLKKHSVDDVARRELEMKQEFTLAERNELAKLIIRKYDRAYLYHCNMKHCAEKCDFIHESCANAGCTAMFSRKWCNKHDAVCEHKVVDCDRLCGERLKRLSMIDHLEHTCELRPTSCPFRDMGCKCDLVVRTLPKHMQTNVQEHLLLTLTRLHEHEGVIKALNKRVAELEHQTTMQQAQITHLQGGVAGAVIAIEASEKRSIKALQDEIAAVDKASTRRCSELSTTLTSEVSKLRRSITEVEQQQREANAKK